MSSMDGGWRAGGIPDDRDGPGGRGAAAAQGYGSAPPGRDVDDRAILPGSALGGRQTTDELRILRGPGLEDENAVRERMDAESPDGRPPPLKARRNARTFFIVALTVVTVGALIAVYAWGGWAALGVAVALWAIFIGFAAWPAWHAAADRKIEENKARREIAEERRGQPPAAERERAARGW